VVKHLKLRIKKIHRPPAAFPDPAGSKKARIKMSAPGFFIREFSGQ
jgi:hypothetical protein